MKRRILIIISLVFFFGLIFFLAKVFSGTLILPQTFALGPLTIHFYGITMAMAVAAGFYVSIKRAAKYEIEIDKAEDLIFWLIVGGFVGARLYYVASSFSYYVANPVDILKVWNGGLSIYGAVMFGIATLWLSKKIFNLKSSILNLLDWLTPSLIVGQIIGRLGNFFNYEAFGYPTHLPWKMFVPESFRPEAFANFQFFHPWFLYEQIGNLIILFLIWKWELSRRDGTRFPQPGRLFFSYVLLYNSVRFCLEFLRIDSTFIGVYRLNAITSLGLVLVAAACLIGLKWSNKTQTKEY